MYFNYFVTRFFRVVLRPIEKNLGFFFFMYILTLLVGDITEVGRVKEQVGNSIRYESLFDIYAICVILTCIPVRIRLWVRGLLYLVFYSAAIVDVYCFQQFRTTFNPSMLLLVGETNAREASEFLRSFLSMESLSRLFSLLWLPLLHIALSVFKLTPYHQKLLKAPWVEKWCECLASLPSYVRPTLGLMVFVCLSSCAICTFSNKELTHRLFTRHSIGEVEHVMSEHDKAVLYSPFHRLLFSIYANKLVADQLVSLKKASHEAKVDSCSFRSRNIVLIIGESYGKHHSQQYGYFMPTTPRQLKREKNGLLVKFTDVISPWNLTSYVFKNMFSMHVEGDRGEWCDYPLFPQLFREAGYHVTFLTNQFLTKAKEAVYDFSGGFFLNNPEMSSVLFDERNPTLYRYDGGLINYYKNLEADSAVMFGKDKNNLIIFHLMGQHLRYENRYPKERRHFKGQDYIELRSELSSKKRDVLANYDNAVLYNDSIVDQICRFFEKKDAIVIYVPDHGEECYEENRNFICRNHSPNIDRKIAHYEYEIPFWIWCSHKYAVRHPQILKEIIDARKRRFMTDALPHMLLYMAGIHTSYYKSAYNVLSSDYQEKRPRLLQGHVDYDKLMESGNK